MLSATILSIKSIINHGHARSIKAKQNIIYSFFVKGCSISISLLLVPLTINYVTPTNYGIWLTLSSIVGWFSFFDVGLSNGLRNKFAVAKAEGNKDLAQVLVSTTYAILSLVFFGVWIIFLLINPFLDWSQILNIPSNIRTEISKLSLIVFTYFCLQFVLKIISTILIADQNSGKSSLIDLFGQILSLLFILILIKTTEGSLINLGLALCLSPILVLVCANLYFFKNKYNSYKPKLSKINFKYAKGLFNLGLVFFVIQIAGVVQYQSANIIIARNFNPAEVTSYNIVFKYFGMLSMLFTIFVVPFWSSSTEAYINKDYKWIKNGVKKYSYLHILLCLLGFLMLLFADNVYTLWLGKGTVNISANLSIWGLLYFIVAMFADKYLYFLNGISALRIQLIACLFSPFIYIAITYVLINHLNFGVHAVFIAAIIANFNGYLLAPLQYHMIINKNKKGIWIK